MSQRGAGHFPLLHGFGLSHSIHEASAPRTHLPYHVNYKHAQKEDFKNRARIMLIKKKLPEVSALSQIKLHAELQRRLREAQDMQELLKNTELHGRPINDNYFHLEPEHVPRAFWGGLKPATNASTHMMGGPSF